MKFWQIGSLCLATAMMAACQAQSDRNAESNQAAVESGNDVTAPADEQALVAIKPLDGELTVKPYGTVLTGAIWKKTAWPQQGDKQIAVCWENPGASDAHHMAIVRQAVTDSWQRVSWLSFTGWQRCSDNLQSSDIRIRIANVGPSTPALGRYLGGRSPGMFLTFAPARFREDCVDKIDFCIAAIAVHEFGHALGFAHEQNRNDAPEECRGEHEGVDGDWNVTSYDEASIMNYCNARWNNDGLLSSRDVEAVTSIYGTRV